MEWGELIKTTLLKRYKRFLADVNLIDGRQITVHCPNTGAMTGCAEPGGTAWLSLSANPKRKYAHTWELLQTVEGDWICIHSSKANALIVEAIENGVVAELQGYDSLETEVKYGQEKSRIDILLTHDREQCFVEVKSVTLLVERETGLGIFPDAVSERGCKHLRELMAMKAQGHRAVLIFCVLHSGIESVAPADSIDAKYANTFREAVAAGVEVYAYRATINEREMILDTALKVLDRQP